MNVSESELSEIKTFGNFENSELSNAHQYYRESKTCGIKFRIACFENCHTLK